MLEFGLNLGLPHIKPMGKGLFEMRIKGKESIARVFFCTKIDKKIIVLHVFAKKPQKTPKKELKLANARMLEVINHDA